MHVPRRQAIRHGKSRKGPWHMAKTIASGVGMTNDWLASQGVLSLKTLWAELAHLREAAAAPLCVPQRGRTRMLGGVGMVPVNGHPYPIYALLFLVSSLAEPPQEIAQNREDDQI